MTSDDLTREQAEALKAEFGRMLRYLGALQKRMHRRRFPPNDPLVISTREAYNAVREPHTVAHYLSVESGAGRPARERAK